MGVNQSDIRLTTLAMAPNPQINLTGISHKTPKWQETNVPKVQIPCSQSVLNASHR